MHESTYDVDRTTKENIQTGDGPNIFESLDMKDFSRLCGPMGDTTTMATPCRFDQWYDDAAVQKIINDESDKPNKFVQSSDDGRFKTEYKFERNADGQINKIHVKQEDLASLSQPVTTTEWTRNSATGKWECTPPVRTLYDGSTRRGRAQTADFGDVTVDASGVHCSGPDKKLVPHISRPGHIANQMMEAIRQGSASDFDISKIDFDDVIFEQSKY